MTPNYNELASTSEGKLLMQLVEQLITAAGREAVAYELNRQGKADEAVVAHAKENLTIARENLVNHFFYRYSLQLTAERKLRDIKHNLTSIVHQIQSLPIDL